MLIYIHDNLLISDLQDRFSKCFHFLKIEFYVTAHHPDEASAAADMIPVDKKIADIRSKHINGILDIRSWDKVEKVKRIQG